MKIFYPDSLDAFNLRPSREMKNAAVRTNAVEADDLLYIAAELERKVGANNSTDPASLEFRMNAVGSSLSALQLLVMEQAAAIAGLEASLRALTFRSRRDAVGAGGTTIDFPAPMAAGYVILGSCYNAAGEIIGFTLSNQTNNGFDITPDDDGTFEWVALPNL